MDRVMVKNAECLEMATVCGFEKSENAYSDDH
jgi:hypothetical protein